MGHTGVLLEEEPPMFRDTGDGKDVLKKQSGDNLSANKKNRNESAGAGLLKDGSDGHDCSQDTAEVPLSCFIDLAERQASVEPATKRMKTSSTIDVDGTVRHVADIVLVLAGLGLIRAGREPTHAERKLQAEAYGHLGFLVQDLDPRDLVSPSSVENLIEDLGLRKPKDQEVKTFAQILESFQPPPSMQTEPMQNGMDAALAAMAQIVDGRSLEESDPHKFLLSASKMLHTANDDIDQLQSDLNGQGSLHLEGDDSPSDSFSMENLGQKHGEAAGSHKQFTQAIQDLLQPRYPADYPFQAAHSRVFMSAAMPCDMCKMIVRETVNVLVCDTCEKVFHLRCLQSYLLMGIPKGDWHCPKCTAGGEDSQQKHQAPKYGQVKAGFSFTDGSGSSITKSPAKGPSNSQKTKQPASIADGKSSKEAMAKSTGKISTVTQKLDDQAPDTNKLPQKLPNHGSVGGSFTALLDSFAQDRSRSGMLKGQASNNQSSSLPQAQTTTRSAFLRSQAGQSSSTILSQSQLQGVKDGKGSAKVAGKDGQSKITTHVTNPSSLPPAGAANGSKQCKPIEESESLDDTSMESEEEEDCDGMAKETDRFGVEWIGDIIHKNDGKNFYSACTVGGYVYRLRDCALFRPETPNVPPYIARLQALWEDTNTGSKWVRVNWCYYPADMAMLAGRPSNPEIHEVYESNHGDNNLVGTIQGQCLVLQPESYNKEMERRQDLLKSGNTGESLVPIFLCRWLYDVPTATFRPATEAP